MAARGAVEKWLLQVQDVMLISIRDVIEKARDVSIATCLQLYVCMQYPNSLAFRISL